MASARATGPDVKYAAELARVREAALLGSADLDYWRDRLRGEDLVPLATGDRAQILIIAAAGNYLGVPFREVSVNVLTAASDQVPTAGAFLVRAFNSCRFFAFCERAFFSTPYVHATVRVDAAATAFEVADRRGARFRASLDTDNVREVIRTGDAGWSGPVFLPNRRPGRAGHWFYARVHGDTWTYPFLPGRDAVAIEPRPECEALQALVDSHFTGREWAVRLNATHAKSKTYPWSELATRL
jgi:hypothetical protein